MTNATARVTNYLTREEIKALHSPTNWEGFLALAVTWSMIAGAFALVAWQPTWWTVMVALVILGGRQLGLAILMHECAHRSLFRSKWLNDWVGKWFCAEPTWNHLASYRLHHLGHHRYTGTDRDPDVGLVKPFPTTGGSLLRKALRDLSALAGLRRLVLLTVMDAGFLTYTASNNAKRVPKSERSWRSLLTNIWHNIGPVLLTNGILLTLLWVVASPWLYLLWLGAYLTTYSLFLRVRAVAEHACTTMDENPFTNTRTTYANPLARLTVAPHRVNYHLEHHLLMSVPHYRLPRMHRMLKERGALTQSPIAPSYWSLLRQVRAQPRPA